MLNTSELAMPRVYEKVTHVQKENEKWGFSHHLVQNYKVNLSSIHSR